MAKKIAKRKSEVITSAPISAQPGVDLSYIAEGLRILAEPIDQLVLDPRNARKHGERSVSAIAASLREFGIRKPIVVRRQSRVVIAGNGSLEAARLNGWTHYPVLWVDDDDQTATKFAIADNRVAELSEWDQEQLAALLQEVDAIDDDLRRVFDDLSAEIAELAGTAEASAAEVLENLSQDEPANPGDASPAIVGRHSKQKWLIVISCKGQEDQQRLLKRLTDDGLQCTASGDTK